MRTHERHPRHRVLLRNPFVNESRRTIEGHEGKNYWAFLVSFVSIVFARRWNQLDATESGSKDPSVPLHVIPERLPNA